MDLQLYPYPEILNVALATYDGNFVADPSVPPMLEDPVFTGSLVYEYLANETNGASGPYFFNWSGDSQLTGCAYTGFGTPAFPTDNSPFFPPPPLLPLPQEPPSPQHGGQSLPRPSCRQGTPSFSNTQEKWSCSVCKEVFYNKYECDRHIRNAGKRAMCLACGKILCARKDNRKRHYTKYCRRMDLGKHGGLRLEDTFSEV